MKFQITIGIGCILFGIYAQATPKVVGQLGKVEGEVLVDHHAVRQNAPVREGSVIEVKDGKATLLLGKGSVFHLAQNSKMVIDRFGVKADGKEEEGELDLRFGRTRALILNQGNEKKDLKIKARAATMGVRGTEIFIDAPENPNEPVQFFTLEGKADVRAYAQAPAVPVNQNQGVSASGKAGVAPPTLSMSEVKSEIKSGGMEVRAADAVRDQKPESASSLNGSLGIGSVPQIKFDPIQDRLTPVGLAPIYCSATSGCR